MSGLVLMTLSLFYVTRLAGKVQYSCNTSPDLISVSSNDVRGMALQSIYELKSRQTALIEILQCHKDAILLAFSDIERLGFAVRKWPNDFRRHPFFQIKINTDYSWKKAWLARQKMKNYFALEATFQMGVPKVRELFANCNGQTTSVYPKAGAGELAPNSNLANYYIAWRGLKAAVSVGIVNLAGQRFISNASAIPANRLDVSNLASEYYMLSALIDNQVPVVSFLIG